MKRKGGRNHGEVFTSPKVVRFMLDEVGYKADRDLRSVKVLEPAAGAGEFAQEIVQRLILSSETFGFDLETAIRSNLVFVEQDQIIFIRLKNRLKHLFPKFPEILEMCCHCDDFLRRDFTQGFDLVIGNPPYIRHERIPDAEKTWYRQQFETFKFRADLYITFFEKGLKLLQPQGRLSFICSNRWLTNQYGTVLRQMIATRYRLEQLLNIEKSSPFDEEVIAYPCIIKIQHATPATETLVYDTQENLAEFDHLPFSVCRTPVDADWHNLFVHYDLSTSALTGIADQGFKIGIGVATGADEVFVLPAGVTNGIEANRLLPIIKSKDIRKGQIHWSGAMLVNPYDDAGLCDLSEYPGLNSHFENHRARLIERHTAKNNIQKWYKTIDRITPDLRLMPKILLPDFGGTEWLLVEEGRYYPHHNLYYITGNSIDDLKVLAAILVSDTVRGQLYYMGVRMNHGLPRLQAQTLRKLRIPDIKALTSAEYQQLLHAYQQQDRGLLTETINHYFRRLGLNEAITTTRQAG